MVSAENKIGNMVDHVTDYLDARRDLLLLNASERAGDTINGMAIGILSAIVGFIVMITLSMGIGIMLGNWLGNLALGFFITSAIWVILLFLMIFIVKRWVTNAIYNHVQKLVEN